MATEGETLYSSSRASRAPHWQLTAVHASTGAQRWRSTGITGELAGLVAGDGVVCGNQGAVDSPHAIFAVDASDGRDLWQADSKTLVQDAAVAGDALYVIDGNGEVYAIQA